MRRRFLFRIIPIFVFLPIASPFAVQAGGHLPNHSVCSGVEISFDEKVVYSPRTVLPLIGILPPFYDAPPRHEPWITRGAFMEHVRLKNASDRQIHPAVSRNEFLGHTVVGKVYHDVDVPRLCRGFRGRRIRALTLVCTIGEKNYVKKPRSLKEQEAGQTAGFSFLGGETPSVDFERAEAECFFSRARAGSSLKDYRKAQWGRGVTRHEFGRGDVRPVLKSVAVRKELYFKAIQELINTHGAEKADAPGRRSPIRRGSPSSSPRGTSQAPTQ